MPKIKNKCELRERESTFIFDFEYFGVLNVEIGEKMAKLRIFTFYEVSVGHLEVMVW